MRAILPLAVLLMTLLAPMASATHVVTLSCELATVTTGALGTGQCSVGPRAADLEVRVTVTVWDGTMGYVHVDFANNNGGRTAAECPNDGTAHTCVFLVGVGSRSGLWTVTGTMVNEDLFGGRANATITVDFVTSF